VITFCSKETQERDVGCTKPNCKIKIVNKMFYQCFTQRVNLYLCRTALGRQWQHLKTQRIILVQVRALRPVSEIVRVRVPQLNALKFLQWGMQEGRKR
jgi:hypothetical protein